jgi:hypothetical protein
MAHLCIFYFNYCLLVPTLPYYQSFFLSLFVGGLLLIEFMSFIGAWLLGLFCFRTAWNLYPEYKEYRIFLFCGLICFWPTAHMIIIFISSGVGLLGSPDDTCCC